MNFNIPDFATVENVQADVMHWLSGEHGEIDSDLRDYREGFRAGTNWSVTLKNLEGVRFKGCKRAWSNFIFSVRETRACPDFDNLHDSRDKALILVNFIVTNLGITLEDVFGSMQKPRDATITGFIDGVLEADAFFRVGKLPPSYTVPKEKAPQCA